MLMQNFGATNKEYYGMLWYFLEWSICSFKEPLDCYFLFIFSLLGGMRKLIMTEKRTGEITKTISCIIIMGLPPKTFCFHRAHAQ